jgi:hypothetical protein
MLVDLESLARPLPLELSALRALAEILAARRLDRGNKPVPLSREEWLTRWRDFQQQQPHFLARRAGLAPP